MERLAQLLDAYFAFLTLAIAIYMLLALSGRGGIRPVMGSIAGTGQVR